ncbi:MAG: hypothetical protein ABW189_01625 [Rickettsiales bacterium]
MRGILACKNSFRRNVSMEVVNRPSLEVVNHPSFLPPDDNVLVFIPVTGVHGAWMKVGTVTRNHVLDYHNFTQDEERPFFMLGRRSSDLSETTYGDMDALPSGGYMYGWVMEKSSFPSGDTLSAQNLVHYFHPASGDMYMLSLEAWEALAPPATTYGAISDMKLISEAQFLSLTMSAMTCWSHEGTTCYMDANGLACWEDAVMGMSGYLEPYSYLELFSPEENPNWNLDIRLLVWFLSLEGDPFDAGIITDVCHVGTHYMIDEGNVPYWNYARFPKKSGLSFARLPEGGYACFIPSFPNDAGVACEDVSIINSYPCHYFDPAEKILYIVDKDAWKFFFHCIPSYSVVAGMEVSTASREDDSEEDDSEDDSEQDAENDSGYDEPQERASFYTANS